jgi:hypothetical protein
MTALVLALWVVAVNVYPASLRSWFGTPSSDFTEMPKGKRERMEKLETRAMALAGACLVLDALVGLAKRMRPAKSGQEKGATDSPGTGPGDEAPPAAGGHP